MANKLANTDCRIKNSFFSKEINLHYDENTGWLTLSQITQEEAYRLLQIITVLGSEIVEECAPSISPPELPETPVKEPEPAATVESVVEKVEDILNYAEDTPTRKAMIEAVENKTIRNATTLFNWLYSKGFDSEEELFNQTQSNIDLFPALQRTDLRGRIQRFLVEVKG